MRDKVRSLADASGLSDVWRLRQRIRDLEEGLGEHRALQSGLQVQIDELERLVRVWSASQTGPVTPE